MPTFQVDGDRSHQHIVKIVSMLLSSRYLFSTTLNLTTSATSQRHCLGELESDKELSKALCSQPGTLYVPSQYVLNEVRIRTCCSVPDVLRCNQQHITDPSATFEIHFLSAKLLTVTSSELPVSKFAEESMFA